MFKDLYMYFKQGQWRYKKLIYKYKKYINPNKYKR